MYVYLHRGTSIYIILSISWQHFTSNTKKMIIASIKTTIHTQYPAKDIHIQLSIHMQL